ncbi:HEAT repeat domain-containing protein [Micromonospora sp. B9E7]|uniref:HEAT repeat domain-containing protein n=1 Tax=Micromonospora sp. B9E7 TaxID=3153574 RepID=UPI00325DFAEA
MVSDAQLSRIGAQLNMVAASPLRFLTAFGAKTHGYQLRPPPPESRVSSFETQHGIALPEGYRRFILGLGDGGAGPGYGLLSLADAYEQVSDSFAGHLAAPSPFVPGTRYEPDWWDGFWGPDDRPDPQQGTLAIVHHGCTSYTLLVVSGPGWGRLVNVDLNGAPAPYVLEDEDFLSWYERWLDELVAGYDVTWFGEKIPGDEARLLGILSDDPSPHRRARAARSLGTLPALSPTGVRGLAAAVADDDPLVREAALRVGARHRAAGLEPAARARLADVEAPVRATVIGFLAALDVSDLADQARVLLGDPDREVRRRAMQALADTGTMTVADLARLVAGPDAGSREFATYLLARVQGGVVDLLAGALDDDDPRVRRQAVQTAEKRAERALLPAMRRMLETETDAYVRTNLTRVARAWMSD